MMHGMHALGLWHTSVQARDRLRRDLEDAQQAVSEAGMQAKEIEMLKKALAKAEKLAEEQKAALQDASDAAADAAAAEAALMKEKEMLKVLK